MRSTIVRAALILSVGGLAACGGNHMAPVVFHGGGRLSEEASLPQAEAPVGDALAAPVAMPRVERQSLDVTSSALPPPGAERQDNSSSSPLVVAAPMSSQPMASLNPPLPPSAGVADIIVKPGDTIYSLARMYSTTRAGLIAENNLQPPYALKVGSHLKLPGASARMAGGGSSASAEGGPMLRLGQLPPPPASAPTPVDPPTAPDIAVATPSPKGFIWPVSGKIVADFGLQAAGRTNDGIDIAVPEGTAVRAAKAGEVIYTGNELRGYGNLVLIKHDDGYVSAYAHNSKIIVKRGEFVRQGQHISDSGSSGNVHEPQVHFEIRKDRKPVDPQGYLPRA